MIDKRVATVVTMLVVTRTTYSRKHGISLTPKGPKNAVPHGPLSRCHNISIFGDKNNKKIFINKNLQGKASCQSLALYISRLPQQSLKKL